MQLDSKKNLLTDVDKLNAIIFVLTYATIRINYTDKESHAIVAFFVCF